MKPGMKPGYLTTEFWLTLVSLVVSGVVGLGFLPADQGEQLQGGLTSVIAGIFMVIPVALYIWGRATVKSATVTALANATSEQAVQIESAS